MAIEADSAAWTGGSGNATAQVCAWFTDQERLQEALSRLEGSAFQRADLSLHIPGAGEATPVREDDIRNLRTLGVGMGSFLAAAAAAGITIATGGAALPAVAAAAAAGGAAALAGEAVGQAAAPGGEGASQRAAEQGGVVLMVHAASPEKQARAEQILRECGAGRLWRQAAGDRPRAPEA